MEEKKRDPDQPLTTAKELRGWYAYEFSISAFNYGTIDLIAIFITDQGQRLAQRLWCEREFGLFEETNSTEFDLCIKSFWAKDFENAGTCQTGNVADNFPTNSSCVAAGGNWIADWNPEAAIVDLFGLPLGFTATFQTSQTASTIIQIVLILGFGALADFGGYRKYLFIGCNILAFLPLMLMWAFRADEGFAANCLIVLITTVMLNCAYVCYNAWLPLLVRHEPKVEEAYDNPDLSAVDKLKIKEKRSSTISSIGLQAGYFGTVLFLVIVLGMFALELFPATPEGDVDFFSLVATLCAINALLWTGYASYSLYPRPGPPLTHSPITIGLRRLFRTLKHGRKLPALMVYLASFFLYSDGVSTIGGAVAVFATQELQMATTEVLILLLEAVLCYGLGAILMIKLKNRYSLPAKWIICFNLFVLGLVPVYALVALTEKIELYIVAIFYGLSIGSLNSLARSEYANLIPLGHEAEFFSLLQITDKGTAWLGPLVLSIVATSTGSFRSAFGYLLIFFFGGLLIFLFFNPVQADADRQLFEQREKEEGLLLIEEEFK